MCCGTHRQIIPLAPDKVNTFMFFFILFYFFLEEPRTSESHTHHFDVEMYNTFVVFCSRRECEIFDVRNFLFTFGKF